MTARIVLTVDEGAVRSAFAALQRRVSDLTPVMDEIGAALAASAKLRFGREQDPQGQAWKPVAPQTRRRKAKAGRERVLQWAGHLKSSITHVAGALEVAVGTNVKYAAIHQLGGQIMKWAHGRRLRLREVVDADGHRRVRFAAARHKRALTREVVIGEHWVTIPARPFLGVSAADRQAILEIVERAVQKAGAGA